MSDQEVLNYLLAYNNMKIIQRKDMFNFSLDTVLLAHFCTINKDLDEIVDFGTNNAAIPLLLILVLIMRQFRYYYHSEPIVRLLG